MDLLLFGRAYNGHTDFHMFVNGTVDARRDIDEILWPHIIPYAGAIHQEVVVMLQLTMCESSIITLTTKVWNIRNDQLGLQTEHA